MSCLVVGDLHLDTYPSFGVNCDGFPKRLDDMSKALNFYLEQAREDGHSYIVFTGDIFDSRFSIHALALVVWGNFLDCAAIDGIKIIVCEGNHDQFDDFISSLQAFKSNIVLVSSVECLELADGTILGVIPYSKSTETLIENIQTVKDCDLVVGHFGMGDVELQKGFCEKDKPIAEDLSEVKGHVILGHYHNYHEVTDRIRFIGTPLGITFAEANQKKYIAAFDLASGVELISTDHFPQLRELGPEQAKTIGKMNDNHYYKVWHTSDTKPPKNKKIVRTVMVKANVAKRIQNIGKKTKTQLVGEFISNKEDLPFKNTLFNMCKAIVTEAA